MSGTPGHSIAPYFTCEPKGEIEQALMQAFTASMETMEILYGAVQTFPGASALRKSLYLCRDAVEGQRVHLGQLGLLDERALLDHFMERSRSRRERMARYDMLTRPNA